MIDWPWPMCYKSYHVIYLASSTIPWSLMNLLYVYCYKCSFDTFGWFLWPYALEEIWTQTRTSSIWYSCNCCNTEKCMMRFCSSSYTFFYKPGVKDYSFVMFCSCYTFHHSNFEILVGRLRYYWRSIGEMLVRSFVKQLIMYL